MTLRQLTLTLAAAALAGSAHAGTVTYATTAPTATGTDVLISNLTGTSTDAGNVNGGSDPSTYVAADQGAQGQFFTTGSNASGYTLNSISLQNVTYSNTYYQTSGPSTFKVRVTKPGVANALAVLGSETANATGSEANSFGDGHFGGTGTGNFITFNLANPVTLAANTQYGFDVGSTVDFFETNGTNASTAYGGGNAYTTGSGGVANALATNDTGARVFVADLTPTSPVPEASTTLSFGLLLAGGGLLGVRGLVARKRRAASAS